MLMEGKKTMTDDQDHERKMQKADLCTSNLIPRRNNRGPQNLDFRPERCHRGRRILVLVTGLPCEK